MHDKEKLARLFDAALQTEEPPRNFKRNSVVPDPEAPQPVFAAPVFAAPARAPIAEAQAPATVFQFITPGEAVSGPAVWEDHSTLEESAAPEGSAAPDYHAVSEELAGIMDAKMAKQRRKHRRSFLVTLILFLGLTLGGGGWFVSNPRRVIALKTTLSEIRSAGDIPAIIARYNASLDKVAVRGKHIDEATKMMGVDPSATAGEDPNFDKETREMTGPDGGPTSSERNEKLRKKFGYMKTAAESNQ